MWTIRGVPDPEAKQGMRLSPIERAGIMTFHCEAAAFEEAKEKLSGAALSTSPNPADPKTMSPGTMAVVKSAVQAELKRHRGALDPDQDAPPAGRSGGRGKNNAA